MNRTPWLTLSLILVNLGFAFWVSLNPAILPQVAFFASKPTFGAAITSMFVHQNVLHLLANLVFLAAIGPPVERSLGMFRFSVIYFLGGIIGAALHFAFYRNMNAVVPYIGASAAIAAMVACAAVRYWSVKVPLAPKVWIPAWSVAVIWVVLQVLGMFVRIHQSNGQSFVAHIGGLLVGLLLSLAFKTHKVAESAQDQKTMRAMQELGPVARVAALKLVLEGKPEDPEALAHLAECYTQLGEAANEQETLMKLVKTGSQSHLADAWKRLEELKAIQFLPSTLRMKLAESAEPMMAVRILKSIAYGDLQDPERANALLALATKDATGNWIALLKEDYPFDPTIDVARARGLL